jgi:neutral ceramidase
MLIGVGREDITPPVGVFLGGYGARNSASTGLHDRLQAAALAVQCDDQAALLITVDMVGVPQDLVAEVRESLQQSCGLGPHQVMIAASHSHSGPDLNVQDELTSAYREELRLRLVKVAEAAWGSREAGTLRLYQGSCPTTAKNRRPSGGPVDPILTLLVAETASGSPSALLVHYTCHGTVLGADNLLISADYIGALRAHLAEEWSAEPVVLFCNGALGNINPGGYSPEVSMVGGAIPNRTFEDATKLGATLAGCAVDLLQRTGDLQPDKVRAGLGFARMTRKPHPDLLLARQDQSQRQAAYDAAISTGLLRPQREEAQIALAYANMTLKRAETPAPPAPTLDAEIQMLQFGNVALVGIPGEPFCEIGLELRAHSAVVTTLTVGLANGYLGYFPVASAFTEGGYEPYASNVIPGSEAKLIETARALLS